jgi:hypothetical protein
MPTIVGHRFLILAVLILGVLIGIVEMVVVIMVWGRMVKSVIGAPSLTGAIASRDTGSSAGRERLRVSRGRLRSNRFYFICRVITDRGGTLNSDGVSCLNRASGHGSQIL